MAQSRSAQVYADFLLPHLTTEMHLIDVGCGSGELSLELAAEVRYLTGIDGDPAEVELARASAEASSTSNAAFTVGDAYALPLPDSEADAVFGHSVLEALDRPAEAISEMSRVGNGFQRVQAATNYISYGDENAIREFGIGRADDCTDEWYVESAQREGLANLHDLATMRQPWQEWSASATSYAAFAWCRALGWKA
jgi:SAM-dependent methyltransferase